MQSQRRLFDGERQRGGNAELGIANFCQYSGNYGKEKGQAECDLTFMETDLNKT